MEKTKNFFLIHNYNTVPANLLEYCDDYLIMDASDDEEVAKEVEKLHSIRIPNTGHNITSYFQYFADHYEELPEVICLAKGNMIGRHMSEEYFNRVKALLIHIYNLRFLWIQRQFQLGHHSFQMFKR